MCPDDLWAKGRASLEGGTPWEKKTRHEGRGKEEMPRSNFNPSSSSEVTSTGSFMKAVGRSLPRNKILSRRLHVASRPSTTQVTTLPNKIRVATENTPGHFTSLGLYIDAGTRYETPLTSGVSHFLDRLSFRVSRGTYVYLS
jgi:hypothetical protein